VAVTTAALLMFGCGTASAGRHGGGSAQLRVSEGHASYYSRAFKGRRTASGERYDPRAMTAAHQTLPFGTWVRVTRRGGQSVDVRINDRCGCSGGRIIDVSEAAARKLDMMRAGVVPVRLEVIHK
jgi:rare lipoprotein A